MILLCHYFSILLTNTFSYLLSFPWLHLFLCGASFLPSFFLRLLYLWVWCSIISLMLRLVFLIVFSWEFCESVLECTILVVQLNKIFGIITQTIKNLHELYCMVLKNTCFWCDTKSKLTPVLRGGSNKISCFSNPLAVLVNLVQA